MRRTRIKGCTSRQRKPKRQSIGFWKRQTDKIFSEYIRQRNAIDGIATCVTCGSKAPWKKMQNGHYISRSHQATRFDERNCNVQCISCNMFKGGNMDEYALFLIKTYGEDILNELNRLKQTIRKISIPEYQEMIETYKEKIRVLGLPTKNNYEI